MILREHRCEWKHCSNFGLACLDAGRKRHFKLNSNDLKKWDTAILVGRATVRIPPLDLHPMLASASHKKRHSRDQSSDSEDESASRHKRRSSGQNISVHLHQGAERSRRRYHSSSPPSSPAKRGRASRARAASASPFSSPSMKDISLSDYVSWHIAKSPEDAEAYSTALETLQSAHIKVHQFSMLSQAQWDGFGIPWGISTSLKTEISGYRADKRLGNVRS